MKQELKMEPETVQTIYLMLGVVLSCLVLIGGTLLILWVGSLLH